MTQARRLTIALEGYDRHVPFFMGLVAPPKGIEFEALEMGVDPPGRDGGNLHSRMLGRQEFDIAEVSFSSYVLAKLGGVPLTAVPVFPRRLFSQNHIFVHAASDIRSPRDLIGRRVAIRAHQVTLSVLAKGDLQTEHGLPWREVRWVTQTEGTVAWQPPAEIYIERAPPGKNGLDLLLAREVDAYIDPRPPSSFFDRRGSVRNIFGDPRPEINKYFAKRRVYPIMHVLALKQELAEEFPHLPRALIDVWGAAKKTARHFYDDFCYSLMPLGRWAYEEDERRFGPDPWPSGFAVNKPNLDWFIDYMADQALLENRIEATRLFHPSVLDT
jgi:4,5-dihydroxyphthalate decarboxylase